MTQHYLYESDESDPHKLPSLEVFYMSEDDIRDGGAEWEDGHGEPMGAGWYWWHCFPGCRPWGFPWGPFESEDAALEDAREGLEEDLQEGGE